MGFDKYAMREVCIGALTILCFIACTVILIIGLNFFFSIPTVLALLVSGLIFICVICIGIIPSREDSAIVNQISKRLINLKRLVYALISVIAILTITIVVLVIRLNAIQ